MVSRFRHQQDVGSGFGGRPFHSPPHAEREEIVAMNKIAFVLTGARTPLARFLLTFVFSVALGLAVFMGAGCSDDENGGGVFPQPPPPPVMEWLFDVSGTGPNDVYVCGNKGTMYHFTGLDWSDPNQWVAQDMGVSTPIVTLWENEGTMYAVGHKGKIWRNTTGPQGQWAGMASGVSANLYGIGIFNDDIYACGAEGTLQRLNGGTWQSTPTKIVMRDPGTNDPDTLNVMNRNSDLSSLLAVNQYFIGGAFKTPDFPDDPIGIEGTDGMIMRFDVPQEDDPEVYDWQLIPLRGDQLAESEWILCMTSDPLVRSRNYLGTSEGWLFQLELSETGKLVWVKHFPRVTMDPGNGIRDIWVDEEDNAFLVTDDGQLVLQDADYNVLTNPEGRTLLYDQANALTGIWGTSRDNFYMVGFVQNTIFHCAMVDTVGANVVEVTEINLESTNKGMGAGMDPLTDELGRPRF
jgi:hypothetical protein